MMYWGGNMGLWGYILMGVSFILFWGAVITAIVLFSRSLGAGNRRYEACGHGAGMTANLLAERFARGGIAVRVPAPGGPAVVRRRTFRRKDAP